MSSLSLQRVSTLRRHRLAFLLFCMTIFTGHVTGAAAQLPEDAVQEESQPTATATLLSSQDASQGGLGERALPLALTRSRRPTTTSTLALVRGRKTTTTTPEETTTMRTLSLGRSSIRLTTSSTMSTTTTLSSTSRPASSSTSSTSVPQATSLRYPVDPNDDRFLVGACMGTLPRLEALPGRQYLNYTGTSAADPITLAAQAGMNAIRISTFLDRCTGPTTGFDNSPSWMEREKLYTLDWGCNDLQTGLAVRAKAQGMKLVHALGIGQTMPVDWQGLSYQGVLDNLWDETIRQIKPIIDAGIQPDYVTLGTEETDGMLFNTNMTGTTTINVRGQSNPYKSNDILYQELCGIIPTGNFASWPQLAGFYKQMILAARSAITAGGFDASKTLFGLHSHLQYFVWKNGMVYNSPDGAETSMQTPYGPCNYQGIIPQYLLDLKVADMLDIMGFSGYPDPIHPASNSPSDVAAALNLVTQDLQAAQTVADRYGKDANGKYLKQGMILEVGFRYDWQTDEALQNAFTKIYFDNLKQYPATRSALYWEPQYGRNYWEGGQASLYRASDSDWNSLMPVGPTKTFYSFADSD